MKGSRVARKDSGSGSYALIVFVTTHSSLCPCPFATKCLLWTTLIRPCRQRSLSLVSRQLSSMPIVKTAKSGGRLLYFKSKFAQFQYPFKEVYYLETSPRAHRVILYTKTDRLEFTASLEGGSQAGASSLAVPCSFSSILQMWCIWIRKKTAFSFPNGEKLSNRALQG